MLKVLYGMEQTAFNALMEDFIIHSLDNVNVKMDFGMDMYVEPIV